MPEQVRPRMTVKSVLEPGHPAVGEAVRIYERTASLPLEEWSPTTALELRRYLDIIYGGGGVSPVPLEATLRHESAAPWEDEPLPDTDVTWVAFTGGKDSVASALDVEARGRRPVLYQLQGLNRGMGDEPRYAARTAAFRGWPVVADQVSVVGPKSGVMELPTKNQVTAMFLAARMAAEAHAGSPLAGSEFVTGWHLSDDQSKQDFRYDFSDGVQAIAAFNAYLAARFPGLRYRQVLYDTTEAWARIADAGMLQFVKGCVCPLRYKASLRKRNVAKFGWLLSNRCGSCVKCGWEEWALQGLGVLPRDEARLAHGLKWMVRDFGDRVLGLTGDGSAEAVVEFLVPAEEVEKLRRSSWPANPAPSDEAEGTPPFWPSVLVEGVGGDGVA